MMILGEKRVSMRNDGALLLAILWTVGFMGVAFTVLIHGVPEESNAITQQLISIMSMIMAAIAGYFYGASKTNTETTAAALAARRPAPPQNESMNVNTNDATINVSTTGDKTS